MSPASWSLLLFPPPLQQPSSCPCFLTFKLLVLLFIVFALFIFPVLLRSSYILPQTSYQGNCKTQQETSAQQHPPHLSSIYCLNVLFMFMWPRQSAALTCCWDNNSCIVHDGSCHGATVRGNSNILSLFLSKISVNNKNCVFSLNPKACSCCIWTAKRNIYWLEEVWLQALRSLVQPPKLGCVVRWLLSRGWDTWVATGVRHGNHFYNLAD